MCVEGSGYLGTMVTGLCGVLEPRGQTVTGTYFLSPEGHSPGLEARPAVSLALVWRLDLL